MLDDLFPGAHGRKGLSLVEVGEIIRRTGQSQGYEVIAEYPVLVDGRVNKVDWVWRDAKGKVVRAFEVEGRNPPGNSLANDLTKFKILRAQQVKPEVRCAVVTYSVRYTLNDGWAELPDRIEGIRVALNGQRVDCVPDTNLISYLRA